LKKYYKQINENGEFVMLLTYDFEPHITDPLIVEISEEECLSLKAECDAKVKATAEAYKEAAKVKMSEIALKAKAYDIITGVSE
jgi:hypothetical protein